MCHNYRAKVLFRRCSGSTLTSSNVNSCGAYKLCYSSFSIVTNHPLPFIGEGKKKRTMFKKIKDTDGITRYININHITSFRKTSMDGLVLNMSNGFTICIDMEIDEFKKLIKGNLWQRIWQKLLS